MLKDAYGRTINYLRVSVTDRCNYRCIYCMPACGVLLKSHDEIMSYESIVLVACCAGELGIEKIRLTGGEPLVRKGIEKLVEMLKTKGRFKEITMTTNGSLVTGEKAKHLKRSGLSRINISLDTLDPERFREITRGGDINDVLAGIDAARDAGLDPVKINMVVFEGTTPDEIDSMRFFCDRKGLSLQTIKLFSLYNGTDDMKFPHSFDRPPPCESCNRLRLTADGYIKPCLFSDKEIRVDLDNIETTIRKAVADKPFKGTACVNSAMCQIGG